MKLHAMYATLLTAVIVMAGKPWRGQDEVRATRFVLVDGADQEVGSLFSSDGRPMLEMRPPGTGNDFLRLGFLDDGRVGLALSTGGEESENTALNVFVGGGLVQDGGGVVVKKQDGPQLLAAVAVPTGDVVIRTGLPDENGVAMGATSTGKGYLGLYNEDGQMVLNAVSHAEGGQIGIYDSQSRSMEDPQVLLGVHSEGLSGISLYGDRDQVSSLMSSRSGASALDIKSANGERKVYVGLDAHEEGVVSVLGDDGAVKSITLDR